MKNGGGVIVGTIARDVVQAGFTYDLVQLLKHSPEAEFMIAMGSVIPNMRIILANRAVDSGASHILFIDSDMRFPSSALEKLLKRDLDIVGANCSQRTQKKSTAIRDSVQVQSSGKNGAEEVDMLGFGVMLISTRVFKVLSRPWFQMLYDPQKDLLAGEDVFFCANAREAGFKIYVDHDLSQEVSHTGAMDFGVV